MRYYEILWDATKFFFVRQWRTFTHNHNQWRTFTNFGVARMPNPLFLGRFSVKKTENFFALCAKDTMGYYGILWDTMGYYEIL